MTKLEEIARAIHNFVPLTPSECSLIARIAVEVMRQPPPVVASPAYHTWDQFGEDALLGPEELLAIWQAMIDAVLNEKP